MILIGINEGFTMDEKTKDKTTKLEKMKKSTMYDKLAGFHSVIESKHQQNRLAIHRISL